jgi:hypothetical protein
MRRPSSRAGPRSKVVSIIWFLASVLVLFAVENIWIDPWLRNKSRHIPTFVPEPLGGVWFLAFLLVAISCVLLVVAQILVALDRGIPVLNRMGTGFATLSALLLCVLWFRVTSGVSSAPSFRKQSNLHVVTLTWMASNSPAAGYNVYRGSRSGGPYARINSDLVRALTYRDQNVQSGMTYYYVTKAVDAKGQESGNSEETSATVP